MIRNAVQVFTFSLATIGIEISSMSTNIAACSRKFSAKLTNSPLTPVLSSAVTSRKLAKHHKIYKLGQV